MWLITSFGFFSVVQKPTDKAGDTLTIRARVGADLEALREKYLPSLGQVVESKSNDYRYRATAPRAEVAAAMAAMVGGIDYSNYKDEVAKVQGAARAHLYHDVWSVLYRLQTESKKFATPRQQVTTGAVLHPRKDEHGRSVELKKPSKPTPLEAWHQNDAMACVLPDGEMPAQVNGIPIQAWGSAPSSFADWESLAQAHPVDEPDFNSPRGLKPAAGVVIREKDGRVWLAAPSNGFGGYAATFPKGTREQGLSNQATALMEAYQETGLRVRLVRHLIDVKRSTSYTRYYLAERIGGDPAVMGWETQAVMLVPQAQWAKVLNSPHDTPIVDALIHA